MQDFNSDLQTEIIVSKAIAEETATVSPPFDTKKYLSAMFGLEAHLQDADSISITKIEESEDTVTWTEILADDKRLSDGLLANVNYVNQEYLNDLRYKTCGIFGTKRWLRFTVLAVNANTANNSWQLFWHGELKVKPKGA